MERIRRILAGWLIFTLMLLAPAAAQDISAAKIPGFGAKVTEQNVLKILNRYDKDGAYIVKKQMAAGDDILEWFTTGRMIDGISIAVHEETHAYSIRRLDETNYFVGNKTTIPVRHTAIYQTRKMAKSIPKRLRTFRYPTYVSKPIANMASNIQGAYGLMNEFMAYRMSMNNTVCLYPYYVDKDADWDKWKVYINLCENGRLAYAEFKYYILHYLYYAKNHYPKVYQGIVKNKPFCRVYRTIEKSYARLNEKYEKDLKKLKGIFLNKGYQMTVTDAGIELRIGRSIMGIGRFTADYKKLVKEMKKGKYQAVHKKLVG